MDRLADAPMLTAEEELILGGEVQKMMVMLQGHGMDGLLSAKKLAETNLSTEEKKILKKGTKARERMISANMRLVVYVASRMATGHIHMKADDLIQEGAIGLARAVEKFDPTRGYKFSTYAYWWIKQSISRATENQETAIRLPSNVQKLAKQASAARDELVVSLGKEPSLGEIASALGEKDVAKVRRALLSSVRPVPLDIRLGDEADSRSLIDLVSADENQRADMEETAARIDFLAMLISRLPQEELVLITQKYGIGTKQLSVKEIAAANGMREQAVRDRHTKILNKIRYAAGMSSCFC